MKTFILLVPVLLLTRISHSQGTSTPGLSKFFQGHDGAFVVYDMNRNTYTRYNEKRCAERFLPASTYKIPNAIIGLETAVIPDSDYVIKWDSTHYQIDEWNHDQTLKSALQYSAVWYFQELARRVGREREQHFLDTLGYGNRTIGDKVDRFWLDNSLKISADEQVEFLKKFYKEELPVSKRSMEIVKAIMSTETHGNAVIKFKTGTGHTDHFIGWLVGYVEKEGDVYIFAFNADAQDFQTVSGLRNEAPIEIMKEMKILPKE